MANVNLKQKNQAQQPEDDEARLEALENEIKQAQESLESDFASYAAEKLNDEKLEELFFEDKEGFIKAILALQNEFLSGLEGKIQDAKNLRGKIDEKKAFDNIEQAAQAFDAKGYGVTSDDLLDYFQNDLTPREKKEFENLDPAQFFDALYQKQQGKNATVSTNQNQNSNALPARLNASSANVDSGGDEVMTKRY